MDEIRSLFRAVSLPFFALSIFLIPSIASAETVEAGCMQDIAGFELQCTANDIQVAGVARNADGSPQLTIHDDGCAYPGDTVSFTATFDVVTTAKSRHDIGIYFVTDGDPNGDGAISGRCNVSTVPHAPVPDWLDLDGTTDPWPGTNEPSGLQDVCGDIDKPDHNPLHPTLTLTATCTDPDHDGFLNLPNCTSWRQAGANEYCSGPLDAFPGAPSKCRCDSAFNIPIEVPPAVLLVNKTASPAAIAEPGGEVTFSVAVTNVGVDPENPAELFSLVDDIYGDITSSGHDGILSTTCAVPQTIAADDQNPGGIDTYSCAFTVSVTGNAGDVLTDWVMADSIDTHGNKVSGADDASVTITDVLPQIRLSKTASVSQVLEPGGDVTFTVVVENLSASSDPVTVASLTDSIYGDLGGKGSCSVPQVIEPGSSYTCAFTVMVTGNAGEYETDIVTAAGQDDDGNPTSASDSATVTILDQPSEISVAKSASPTTVLEPGGNVTYTYTVNNLSAVDTVTLSSLVDNLLGDLDGQGDCSVPQDIVASGSYTCSVVATVSGNAGDSITNVITVAGVDDDGKAVMTTDSATVNVENVAPAASLTKVAQSAIVSYAVTVRNDSDAESLTLDALVDDRFGDVTMLSGDIIDTNCSVPQVLQPAGEPGDTYTCSFDAFVGTSPHTNTLTGTVRDDDGSSPVMPSDSATVTLE